MSNLIEVFRSESTLEAQMKAQVLEQCGLNPALFDENLASVIGMGTHAVPCRVLVPETQSAKAMEILQSLEVETENIIADPTNCPACNAEWEKGFTVCWSCQRPLEE